MTCHHFCLLKLTKYLKILSVRMNISNTNEYWFPILYICIYYNPPSNPVKFKMVDFSSFLFAQIYKIFENFVRLDEYLQHQWIFVFDNLHMHLLQSSHESLELTTEFLPGGGYHCVSDILVNVAIQLKTTYSCYLNLSK